MKQQCRRKIFLVHLPYKEYFFQNTLAAGEIVIGVLV